MAETCQLAVAGGLSAIVAQDGAELVSITSPPGDELLWQAGPEWRRHAPVLFPIVGRLANDTLRHAGRSYPMTQHGFARDRRFEWASRTDTACTLALVDDDGTRQHYPFSFRLEITYSLQANALTVGYALTNPGETVLPAALGAHPAFLWPAAGAPADVAHDIVFDEPEDGPVHRLQNGLLGPAIANPIHGSDLRLDPTLFTDDALILLAPRSRGLLYGPAGAPTLRLTWHGLPQLGLWSKPSGAPFLCLEPWHGTSDPVGFTGDFLDKPGLRLVPPGSTWRTGWRVEALTPARRRAAGGDEVLTH